MQAALEAALVGSGGTAEVLALKERLDKIAALAAGREE